MKAKVERSKAQKERSKREAMAVLGTLVPELAAGVVGRSNAASAARRVWAATNNQRLNGSVALELLDEIVAVLFGGDGVGLGRVSTRA